MHLFLLASNSACVETVTESSIRKIFTEVNFHLKFGANPDLESTGDFYVSKGEHASAGFSECSNSW